MINYFLLIVTYPVFPDTQRWTDSALPERMSLHRYPSEFLTRQSFDVRALTSPPFALSQHLSRSRAVPETLLPVRVHLSGNKKTVKTDPDGSAYAFDIYSPLSGSESDLTVFNRASNSCSEWIVSKFFNKCKHIPRSMKTSVSVEPTCPYYFNGELIAVSV